MQAGTRLAGCLRTFLGSLKSDRPTRVRETKTTEWTEQSQKPDCWAAAGRTESQGAETNNLGASLDSSTGGCPSEKRRERSERGEQLTGRSSSPATLQQPGHCCKCHKDGHGGADTTALGGETSASSVPSTKKRGSCSAAKRGGSIRQQRTEGRGACRTTAADCQDPETRQIEGCRGGGAGKVWGHPQFLRPGRFVDDNVQATEREPDPGTVERTADGHGGYAAVGNEGDVTLMGVPCPVGDAPSVTGAPRHTRARPTCRSVETSTRTAGAIGRGERKTHGSCGRLAGVGPTCTIPCSSRVGRDSTVDRSGRDKSSAREAATRRHPRLRSETSVRSRSAVCESVEVGGRRRSANCCGSTGRPTRPYDRVRQLPPAHPRMTTPVETDDHRTVRRSPSSSWPLSTIVNRVVH